MSAESSESDQIDAAFPDRSAGRWCGRCERHGSHHTERHVEFLREAQRLATPPGESS